MTTASLNRLTEDERFILTGWSMWGSDGYPVAKRGSRWWVDGVRGLGGCPAGFKTKREAQAQWEAYIQTIIDKDAGR